MTMQGWLRIALVGVVAIWPLNTWPEEPHQSFDIAVPQSPIPVVTEDHVMLAYELHMTNFAAEPLAVKGLHVSDSDTGKELTSFTESSLARCIALVKDQHSSRENLTDEAIPPGERAIIFVEFTVKIGVVPRGLQHQIDYTGSSDGHLQTFYSPTIIVNDTAPVVLGSPFHDGIWVAVHAGSWPRGHRRTTYTLSGKGTHTRTLRGGLDGFRRTRPDDAW
jgi:hypothetical protein